MILLAWSELNSLCFELDIVYENLSGQSLDAKALSLVTYAQRHGLYDKLTVAVQKARPHLDFGVPSGTGGGGVAAPAGQPAAGPTYNFHGNVVGANFGDGTITADNMAGGDINITHNYAEPKDKAAFAEQLAQLEALLKQAIASGEIKDERDAETAVEDIQDAIAEVQHDQPRPSRLTRRLEDVKEIIESASKTGAAALKAVPIISGLIKVVTTLF
ncbi:MAG: hypothetical protein IPJ90_09695 [Anaerolineaceae bacterium]|nr:hypothetical protein [Anaerolineaceae bacterium]